MSRAIWTPGKPLIIVPPRPLRHIRAVKDQPIGRVVVSKEAGE